MKNLGFAFWAFLGKVGLKVLSVLLKVGKSAKVVQAGSAAATIGSYSFLYSWQFAIGIWSMILFHEWGHLLAMKACGIKTKGIYLIPFVGGLAVGDSTFKTRANEVFIALAGPVFGLVMSLGALLVWGVTGENLWAGIAAWWAMINLFNLFPINPLDGGRVVKSVLLSINTGLGLGFLALGLVLTGVLMVSLKLWFLVLILLIGALELLLDLHNRRLARRLEETRKLLGLEAAEELLEREEIKELLIPVLTPMTKSQIAWSVVGYVVIAAALIGITMACSHVQGADIAIQILKEA